MQHDTRTDRSEELSADEEEEEKDKDKEEPEEDVDPTFCWYRAPLVATAPVAVIRNGSAFRKGREFTAGLAWFSDSTRPAAKRDCRLYISERSSIYPRRALISGARAMLLRVKRDTGLWSARNLIVLNFRPLFTLLPSPVGIRDADRPEQGFLPPGDRTEYDDLKFGAPECLRTVREYLVPGGSVAGLGCNEPPTR